MSRFFRGSGIADALYRISNIGLITEVLGLQTIKISVRVSKTANVAKIRAVISFTLDVSVGFCCCFSTDRTPLAGTVSGQVLGSGDEEVVHPGNSRQAGVGGG